MKPKLVTEGRLEELADENIRRSGMPVGTATWTQEQIDGLKKSWFLAGAQDALEELGFMNVNEIWVHLDTAEPKTPDTERSEGVIPAKQKRRAKCLYGEITIEADFAVTRGGEKPYIDLVPPKWWGQGVPLALTARRARELGTLLFWAADKEEE